MPKSVCVIGAGVSGLTCAISIAERDYEVSIIANDAGNQTTSSIAAAFWYPFAPGVVPNHSWYKHVWAVDTYESLETLSKNPVTGVSAVNLYEYFSDDMSESLIDKNIKAMWWRDNDRLKPKLDFDILAASAFQNKHVRTAYFNGGFTAGISFRTFVVNMADYLSYLWDEMKARKIEFQRAAVTNLESLSTKFDVVVNCTGMGSKTLVPTDELEPGEHNLRAVEGIVIAVEPVPRINDITLIHGGVHFGTYPLYIVPRAGRRPDIILGGSTTNELEFVQGERRDYKPQHLTWNDVEPGHWTEEYTRKFLTGCYSFEPRLQQANPLKYELKVGYRPSRASVRLEQHGNIIHNYGHGGAGVTLSWGCAREVADMIDKLL